jgi:hypothetical protein
MPWTPEQASKHDKKATSPIEKRQWSDVANSILKRTGDDARAIRGANSVLAKRKLGGKRKGNSKRHSSQKKVK